MNVYENIRFPLKCVKLILRFDERVRKAADMVELGAFLHRHSAELSGGQRQGDSPNQLIENLILMDEPLSDLDAKLRVSTRAQIKHLQHEQNDHHL